MCVMIVELLLLCDLMIKTKYLVMVFFSFFSKPEQEPENKMVITRQLKRDPRKRLVNWFSGGTPPGPQTTKNGKFYKIYI